MENRAEAIADWRRDPWRYLMWIVAGGLAVVAALDVEAMRQGEYARVILAALFVLACALVELGIRRSPGWAYYAGAALAVLTAIGQVYVNLAAGLVGSADNPFNTMFFAIAALTLTGAVIVQTRASAMVWVMGAATLAQVAAGLVAGMMVPVDTGEPQPAGIMFLTFYVGGLWLNAAALFRVAR
jgi:hypothetical protein